jgi:hypothetical protein
MASRTRTFLFCSDILEKHMAYTRELFFQRSQEYLIHYRRLGKLNIDGMKAFLWTPHKCGKNTVKNLHYSQTYR